jgi:hypothetical protein
MKYKRKYNSEGIPHLRPHGTPLESLRHYFWNTFYDIFSGHEPWSQGKFENILKTNPWLYKMEGQDIKEFLHRVPCDLETLKIIPTMTEVILNYLTGLWDENQNWNLDLLPEEKLYLQECFIFYIPVSALLDIIYQYLEEPVTLQTGPSSPTYRYGDNDYTAKNIWSKQFCCLMEFMKTPVSCSSSSSLEQKLKWEWRVSKFRIVRRDPFTNLCDVFSVISTHLIPFEMMVYDQDSQKPEKKWHSLNLTRTFPIIKNKTILSELAKTGRNQECLLAYQNEERFLLFRNPEEKLHFVQLMKWILQNHIVSSTSFPEI